jgi:hypothetical protein
MDCSVFMEPKVGIWTLPFDGISGTDLPSGTKVGNKSKFEVRPRLGHGYLESIQYES